MPHLIFDAEDCQREGFEFLAENVCLTMPKKDVYNAITFLSYYMRSNPGGEITRAELAELIATFRTAVPEPFRRKDVRTANDPE